MVNLDSKQGQVNVSPVLVLLPFFPAPDAQKSRMRKTEEGKGQDRGQAASPALSPPSFTREKGILVP